MSNYDADLVDIECHLVDDHRDKSIAVADGTEETYEGKKRLKWFWLPKSQIELSYMGRNRVMVTMPRWLAEEKGLV